MLVGPPGETLVIAEGQQGTAGDGGLLVVKDGGVGYAEAGSTFLVEAGGIVFARYGSTGKARRGAKVFAQYGAIIDQDDGSNVFPEGGDTKPPDGSETIKFNDLAVIEKRLVKLAWKYAESAYCPYSDFPVGAAVLMENERGHPKVGGGCNIENASYGGTICAERVAITSIVKEGYRHLRCIAVVCKKHPGGSPCGLCRQVLREFGLHATVLNIFNTDSDVVRWTVDKLLPDAFGPDSI